MAQKETTFKLKALAILNILTTLTKACYEDSNQVYCVGKKFIKFPNNLPDYPLIFIQNANLSVISDKSLQRHKVWEINSILETFMSVLVKQQKM